MRTQFTYYINGPEGEDAYLVRFDLVRVDSEADATSLEIEVLDVMDVFSGEMVSLESLTGTPELKARFHQKAFEAVCADGSRVSEFLSQITKENHYED